MIVNLEKCIGCGKCRVYCPVNAIHLENRKAVINQDLCTECANCLRAQICPRDALEKPELTWPRQVRSQMSDVTTVYRGVNGRGTEEMKTNDVTHRFKKGFAGIAVELGRPQVSTTMRDLEKVSRVVAAHGATFEECNPITSYIIDKSIGQIDPQILDERVISGIIEVTVPIDPSPGKCGGHHCLRRSCWIPCSAWMLCASITRTAPTMLARFWTGPAFGIGPTPKTMWVSAIWIKGGTPYVSHTA